MPLALKLIEKALAMAHGHDMLFFQTSHSYVCPQMYSQKQWTIMQVQAAVNDDDLK